jgi:hypothetical protein
MTLPRSNEAAKGGKSCVVPKESHAQAHPCHEPKAQAPAPSTAPAFASSLLCGAILITFMVLPVRTAAAGDRVPAPVGEPERAMPPLSLDVGPRKGRVAASPAALRGWTLDVGRSLSLADIQIAEGAAALSVLGVFVALIGSHFRLQKYIRDVAGVKETGTMSITGQPIMVAQAREYATVGALTDLADKTDKELKRLREHVIPRSELLSMFKELKDAGASRLSEITERLDRIAGIEGKTAAAFEQFQRDLPNIIRHAK